jgi:hypothetical protein
MERLKPALDVVVPNYVVWTADHAARATGAETRRDYFLLKFFPLEYPTLFFGCFCVAFRHGHTKRLRRVINSDVADGLLGPCSWVRK